VEATEILKANTMRMGDRKSLHAVDDGAVDSVHQAKYVSSDAASACVY
jgi:hypothetical protein